MKTKSYSELIKINTFKDRYFYLRIGGRVGEETFGFDRYLNQILYSSDEWKRIRREVIIRDKGCDLAHMDFEIHGIILVHHINAITIDDIRNNNKKIFDLENLISTTRDTHNAIHYGDDSLLISPPIERFENDTCPWVMR